MFALANAEYCLRRTYRIATNHLECYVNLIIWSPTGVIHVLNVRNAFEKQLD